MLYFVNAKINIGLNIVGRRQDGYHLLETVFYPVGLYNGSPRNPEEFCDIIELTESRSFSFNKGDEGFNEVDSRDVHGNVTYEFSGNSVNCPLEKNLVVRGVNSISDWLYKNHKEALNKCGPLNIRLDKHLPDGAGMGGGSADAVFAMKLMVHYLKEKGLPVPDNDKLKDLAVRIGADCPMFVDNVPAYAEGIGEKLSPLPEFLKGKWLVVVKPSLSISTKEAFAGVTPHPSKESLTDLIKLPLKEWRAKIRNDFEKSLFPRYPELKCLKDELYFSGASYASLTGSGAALYGIFENETVARQAYKSIRVPYKTLILL